MTERIRIIVSQDGARAVRKDIESLGTGADRASRSLGGLGAALKAAVAGVAVRETIKIADAYTNLSNRIRVVTDSENELVAVRSELFRVANQTRGSVESVAQVYSRLALTTQNLGLSQREVITLTESLQQATALSGASSTEASAALVQLAQGMGAGALRGEELNSVLEQTPVIAQVIADHMKVNIGDLRTLGAQGKITGRDIVDAFAEARDELAERFGKTVPTVGGSLTVLKNTVTDLVGQIDEATGSSESLSRGIISISTSIGEAIPDIADLVKELADISELKDALNDVLPDMNGSGMGALQFMVLMVTTLEDRLTGTLRAAQKLWAGLSFGLVDAPSGSLLEDLEDVLTGQGPATARALEVIRRQRGQRRGVTTLNAEPGDPGNVLDARPVASPSRASTAAAKGTTVESILSDLRRENELMRLGNEQRIIEEGVDRARAQLKGKLSAQQEALIRHQLEENRVQQVTNESLDERLRLELELMGAENRAHEARGAAASQRAAEIARIAAEERQKAHERTFEGARDVMGDAFLERTRTLGQEMAAIFGPGGTLQRGLDGVIGRMSDTIGYSIAFSRSWNDTQRAIENIGRSIIAEIISSLIRIPIQMALNETIASGLRAKSTAEMAAASATVTATAAASAAAVGAAWATPAALASAATLGGAGLAGTASLTSSVAAAKALAATGAVGLFADGGYTGDGSRAGVAGIVHGKEFVLHADATARYRREAEAMNAGTWRPGGGSVHVTVVDQTDGGNSFETRQISESEIEIIVRRVAPDAVAADLSSPQSRVGRALSQGYSTKRVRA